MFECFEENGFIACSESMKQVVRKASHVAKVDSTVLIVGESGVGKELVARYIHEQSSRAGYPFVAINCGAISESLLESELFGHAKGSFTGANRDRVGYLEAADGGTLLLDEVGEVSPAMQVKLLRALQEREFCRVGENIPRQFDVRIIAATNRNLADEIQEGRFRVDFYYRLRVIEIMIPSLAKRPEDILPLATMFQERFATGLKRPSKSFSASAIIQLNRYGWPGNVRELSNAVEHAVAMSEGECIDIHDLPMELRPDCAKGAVSWSGGNLLVLPQEMPKSIKPLYDLERDHILKTLKELKGNKVRTAMELKISVATLYRKLNGYRISENSGYENCFSAGGHG